MFLLERGGACGDNISFSLRRRDHSGFRNSPSGLTQAKLLPPNLDRTHSQLRRRGRLTCRLIHATTATWPRAVALRLDSAQRLNVKTNYNLNEERSRMLRSQTVIIYRCPDEDK